MGSNNAQIAMDNGDGGQQNKKSPPATPAFKKRHRGCSHCILDIENTPIPVSPDNEEVVGVITMEDVIEELLQVMVVFEHVRFIYYRNKYLNLLLQNFTKVASIIWILDFCIHNCCIC